MAVDVTYKGVDQAQKDLVTAINRAIALTDRSVSDAVSWAAQNVAVSARAASKVGKKVRKVVNNPRWRDINNSVRIARGLKKKGREIPIQMQRDLNDANMHSPFFIVRKTQSKDVLYPTYERKTTSPLKRIPSTYDVKRGGYGLAKKIFDVIQAKCADSQGKDSFNRRGKDWGVFKNNEKSGTGTNYILRMRNKLPYIEKAYPALVSTAMAKAAKSMTTKINRDIRKMEREFNK